MTDYCFLAGRDAYERSMPHIRARIEAAVEDAKSRLLQEKLSEWDRIWDARCRPHVQGGKRQHRNTAGPPSRGFEG